jgi:hypothetical protein
MCVPAGELPYPSYTIMAGGGKVGAVGVIAGVGSAATAMVQPGRQRRGGQGDGGMTAGMTATQWPRTESYEVASCKEIHGSLSVRKKREGNEKVRCKEDTLR